MLCERGFGGVRLTALPCSVNWRSGGVRFTALPCSLNGGFGGVRFTVLPCSVNGGFGGCSFYCNNMPYERGIWGQFVVLH